VSPMLSRRPQPLRGAAGATSLGRPDVTALETRPERRPRRPPRSPRPRKPRRRSRPACHLEPAVPGERLAQQMKSYWTQSGLVIDTRNYDRVSLDAYSTEDLWRRSHADSCARPSARQRRSGATVARQYATPYSGPGRAQTVGEGGLDPRLLLLYPHRCAGFGFWSGGGGIRTLEGTNGP
jgi:hypothetical protein